MKRTFGKIFKIALMIISLTVILASCGTDVEFKVDFMVDGEVYSTVNTNGGETIKMPTDPSKSGYTFEGWYWDNETWQTPFTANSLLDAPLSSNMKVYAKFTEIDPPHIHSYTDTETSPTCTEQGYTTHTCECGESYNDTYTDELGHDITGHSAKAPTETEVGWEAYETCSRCDHTTYNELPALGSGGDHVHDFSAEVASGSFLAASADCDSAARYYYSCECGAKGTETFVYGEPRHNIVSDAALDPTCSSYGKTAGKHCSICGLVTAEQERVDKLPHKYGANDKCTVCGLPRPTEGLEFTPNPDGESYSVSDIGDATDFEIVIPSEYNSKPVTAIAAEAFAEERWFTDIIIPDSVTSIGDRAFYHCTGLINVTTGDGLKEIGAEAFYHCTGIETIRFGEAIEKIGNNAFFECTGLLYAHITDVNEWCKIDFASPSSNPIYYTHSLYLEDELITDLVIIGAGKTKISKWAFYTCTALTSVDIKSGVFSVGDEAFYDCDNVTHVKIGNGVISVNNSAFKDCDKLKSVTIGSDTTTLNESAFESCDLLESLTMGNGVTNIGDRVFYECKKLVDIVWSNSITSMGDGVLAYCESLKVLELPASVTYVGADILLGCSAIESVTLPFIGPSKNLSLAENSSFSHIFGNFTIPESLKYIKIYSGEIDADDFAGCRLVSAIEFGKEVTRIDTDTFLSLTGLERITVDGANRAYASEGGILYNKAKTEILFIPKGIVGALTFNSGHVDWELIGDRHKLTEVIIIGTATYDDGIFASLTSLKELKLKALNTTAIALFGEAADVPESFEKLILTEQRLTVESAELTGVGFEVELVTKFVAKIEANTKTDAYLDEFWQGEENKIKVTMNDGTSHFINLLPEYISEADNKLLYKKGTHTIGVTYEGVSTSFTVELYHHSYTVTFDKMDGTGGTDSVSATFDSAMPTATAPTRTGYTFLGYYDAGDTRYYNQDMTSAKVWDKETPTTLFAKWSANKYTVTLDDNGGSNGAGSIDATFDSAMPWAKLPARTGYSFVGYFDSRDIKYYNADMISARAWDKAEPTTLYAKWTANTYTVTFDKNGGTGGTDSVSATFDSAMPTATAPMRTGYSFAGYYDGSGVRYYSAYMQSVRAWDKSGETLYARWTANSYAVTFDKNGGTGGSNSIRATYGSEMPPATAPTRAENTFLGYFDASGVKYYDENMASVKLWDKAEKTTLYAKWEGFLYSVNGDEVSIEGYNGTAIEVVIPEYIGGNPVTSIGSDAFFNCTSLKSIEIPSSVTSIGYGAFADCSSLSSITIPDSVTSIGYGAFVCCTSLKSVTFADGSQLESIGVAAFAGCTSLESIEIPSSVMGIYGGLFDGCSGLESITVESGNTVYHSVGNCLIETESKTLIAGCKNSVIPTDGSVTSIGSAAFAGCTSLESIEIPASVTFIDESAFYGCTSLESIEIPASVTFIDESAFYGCISLTSITIPNSVTSIGSSAFSGCSSLESITVEIGNTVYHSAGNCLIETSSKTIVLGCKNSVIPTDESVTSIGYRAFHRCTNLESIEIPASVTFIDEDAFYGCTSLKSIEIPASVTWIGKGAFQYCTSLTSITIPSGTSIDASAFEGCDKLTIYRY